MDKIRHYLKWEDFTRALEEKNLDIFSLSDLKLLFPSKSASLTRFLSRHSKRNHLIRLKRGLYSLKKSLPDQLVLASILYQPSYISLESALSYYSVIPETIYSITSVSSKPTREFHVNGTSYTYNKIKRQAFSDYIVQQQNKYSFLIAAKEKALADYLYFVSLGKKRVNDRIDWTKIDNLQVKKLLSKRFMLKPSQIDKLLP